jgi:predicted aconitase
MEVAMKLTDEDKRLLEASRKLESRKCREMLISRAEAMYEAQEALIADYGLVGLDAPLFNNAGGKPAA